MLPFLDQSFNLLLAKLFWKCWFPPEVSALLAFDSAITNRINLQKQSFRDLEKLTFLKINKKSYVMDCI